MESINWIGLLPVLIPSLVAVLLAVIAFFLKLKKDSMTGMNKELTEFVLAVVEGAKDTKFTQKEILKIIREFEDVIAEARKLLE